MYKKLFLFFLFLNFYLIVNAQLVEISPSSGPLVCNVNNTIVQVTINTDNYPNESKWYLIDQTGNGFISSSLNMNSSNSQVTWVFCIPSTNCYSFVITDSYGDGICCNSGNGSYFVNFDGVQVVNGGSFNFIEETCNLGSCVQNCQITIPSNAISEGESCGIDSNHGCDENWSISNFTIQSANNCAWGYANSWTGSWIPIPCGPEFYPDLFITMTKNSNFYYYSGYYTDTWYPNSFSMYAGVSTAPLEIALKGLYSEPYAIGQTNIYEFSVGDDDGGFIQDLGWNSNDFLGSYTLPNTLNAGVNTITTSTGDAVVDFTVQSPQAIFTPLTNSSLIHGTFWAENNKRDTDWYEFSFSDSVIVSVNSISETPFHIVLKDANSSCINSITLDSSFANGCDSISIQQILPPGSYWIVAFSAKYSCLSCLESIDYLLNVSWNPINPIILGCTDSTMFNYNPNANLDDSSCIPFVYGCTNINSLNFNSLANTDDGSCIPILYGCTDPLAVNYNPSANVNNGSCMFLGCTDPLASNYNVYASIDDSSCIYNIYGCTDSLAYNFNFLANIDDNSCLFLGCTDSTMFNYNPNANLDDSSCIPFVYGCTNMNSLNFNSLANTDDGSCIPVLYGCTDFLAVNFNPGANTDDGSCLFQGCTDILAINYDPQASIDDSSCIYCVYGCMDSNSINFNPLATCDDNSCTVDFFGCTDSLAINYNSLANIDDGSCFYNNSGCMDSLAINYDPFATFDDGSCQYPSSTICTEPVPSGLFVNEIVHDRAKINWNNMNSSVCFVDQYRIKYREIGANTWNQKNMGSPLGSCTWPCNKVNKLILNLLPSTSYEYQIRAWYCGGGNSSWSVLDTFSTLIYCPNIGNLAVTTPTSTKATFTWDDSNGQYNFVRLKARVDTLGAIWFNVGGTGVAHGTFTKNKNGLIPGESYRGQARTWCDPNGGAYKSPSWTSLIYWTQPTLRMDIGATISNLDVYPNPSRDMFNVTFTSEDVQDLEVRVINIIGEEIIKEDLQQFVGEYVKVIDLKKYKKGIYLLEITTNNGIINKKLILQ